MPGLHTPVVGSEKPGRYAHSGSQKARGLVPKWRRVVSKPVRSWARMEESRASRGV